MIKLDSDIFYCKLSDNDKQNKSLKLEFSYRKQK